ncbi:hypothetical protein DES43_12038 [Aquamicrobium defluvii]|uniref:Uncharacterized protein n=1 Tax=Aquamicrobium defluvii TaxID=69279 RepID=A0A4R6YCX6_9HYPH|nr:hypothetical protein DES43_12038 [Aquamicrobium defluvii]
MVGEAHGVQGILQGFGPVVEKAAQFGELRREIVFLPDVKLKQAGMIRHMIMDFSRGEPVAAHLKLSAWSWLLAP